MVRFPTRYAADTMEPSQYQYFLDLCIWEDITLLLGEERYSEEYWRDFYTHQMHLMQ